MPSLSILLETQDEQVGDVVLVGQDLLRRADLKVAPTVHRFIVLVMVQQSQQDGEGSERLKVVPVVTCRTSRIFRISATHPKGLSACPKNLLLA